MKYTKDDLQKMTGCNWSDWQVEALNAMLQAHREGKRLIIHYPRQGKRMIQQTYDTVLAAEGQSKNNVIVDEFYEDMVCEYLNNALNKEFQKFKNEFLYGKPSDLLSKGILGRIK